MQIPTAAQIMEWSKLDFESLDYDEAGVTRLVRLAAASFVKITGQRLSTVPPEDEPLVEDVIKGMAEALAFQEQPDMLETLSDWALISSFSAGAYSESRRGADEMLKARMLHPVPGISSALWGLLSPAKHDYWIEFFGGDPAPAQAVQEVDWSAGASYLTDAGGAPMWGREA